MAKVFISYSSKDRERVSRLAEALAAHDHDVWWDHHLMPGEDYAEKIETALQGADATIVCWSDTAAASDWVRSEADDARARGRLIPVRLDSALPPKPFDRLHTEDLSNWRGDKNDPRILKTSEAAQAMSEGRVAKPVQYRRRVVTAGGLGGLALAANVETVRGWISPAATQESVESLKDEIAELKQLMLAQTAPIDGAPVEAERQVTKAEAAERTARAEPEAARELAAGDLEEGFETLKAAARAKAADAAQEWRDIGALAYDRDPGTALEAYREATRLDGSDFWAWIFLARLEDHYVGDVRSARIAAETASEVAQTDRDNSVALHDLGLILMRLGDLVAAREAYLESHEILAKLAEANKDIAQVQRDVSVSLSRLGDVEMQADDLGAARAAYSESLEIAQKLAEANPESAEAQRDVSVSLSKLGDVEVQAGDLVATRAAYSESLEIRRTLVEANPESAEAQRDVSISLDRLGDVEVKARDLGAARMAYIECLETRRKLAEVNPESPQAQRDVSVSLNKLGDVEVLADDLAAAHTAFSESLALARTLAEANPESAEAQRDVWAYMWRMARYFDEDVSWKDVADAMQAMKDAGTLFPVDEKFLEMAKANAGTEE